MANYILSYDLNGQVPSHEQMDKHLRNLGAAVGRILETVWYVGYSGSRDDLFQHARSILSNNDLLFVAEAQEAIWNQLLVESQSLRTAWEANR
jgi:hypothetical protein